MSVEVQAQLRHACDAIMSENEEEIVEFYMNSKEKETLAKYEFCEGKITFGCGLTKAFRRVLH